MANEAKIKKISEYLNDITLIQYTYDLFGGIGLTTNEITTKIIGPYLEEHRYLHTKDHIIYILKLIHQDFFLKQRFSESELQTLVLAAWFHDIVYNPRSATNEEDSVSYMLQTFKDLSYKIDIKWWDKIREVEVLINDTKHHNATEWVSAIFCSYDMAGLFEDDMTAEYLVFKEYQFADFKLYQQKRIEFLTTTLATVTEEAKQKVLKRRIQWVRNFSPRIGVYAGSFNPLHLGHKNIIDKANEIFDKVIILFASNPEKSQNQFFIGKDTCLERVQNTLPFMQVDILEEKFLTDYFKKMNESSADFVLVKGLRNGDDLSYEENQLYFMKKLYPELKVVFLMCDEEFKHISSSAIRNIAKLDKEEALKYVI